MISLGGENLYVPPGFLQKCFSYREMSSRVPGFQGSKVPLFNFPFLRQSSLQSSLQSPVSSFLSPVSLDKYLTHPGYGTIVGINDTLDVNKPMVTGILQPVFRPGLAVAVRQRGVQKGANGLAGGG